MKVSKGKVISNKDLEILLDRTDLLGEKMLCFTVFRGGGSSGNPFKYLFVTITGVGTKCRSQKSQSYCRVDYCANYTFSTFIFLKSG